MSDRFYTTLHVSGPNAATAEKAAIDAIKSAPKDSLGYHATWIDADTVERWDKERQFKTPAEKQKCLEELGDPHYFDHESGEGAVQTIAEVSRQYPSETFKLFVDGDFDAGVQGPVIIANGKVRDGRNGTLTTGSYEPYCDKCGAEVTSPNLRVALEDMAEHKIDSEGHVECLGCHTVYECSVKDGELVFFGREYEIPETTEVKA